MKVIKTKPTEQNRYGTSMILQCPNCENYNVNGEQRIECEDCGWSITDFQLSNNYKEYYITDEEELYFNNIIKDYGKEKIDNPIELFCKYLDKRGVLLI